MVDVDNISKQKEYYNLLYKQPTDTPPPISFNDYNFLKTYEKQSLNLQGHQVFISNLFHPHTQYKRLLLYHSTGTGKTIVILSIAEMYIKYYKKMKQQPTFTIIGFTEEIIVKELTKYPDFGYISIQERDELERLHFSRRERDIMRRRGLKSMLKRRITDKSRGGYYNFMGYQKFASDLFILTSLGIENNITHNTIYEDIDNFYKKVDELINKKYIEVNRSLLDSLKYGFIACDEIHNVYNAKGKNNRGMAIEYMLRTLEKEDPVTAPKIIFASATPLTGSSSEIVDLMNILIPGVNYKRSDFFNGTEFKSDTLERIGKLCNGYVSFLKDTNVKEYPKRIFEGESIFNIKYLQFTLCPMSAYQEKTLSVVKNIDVDAETLLSTNTYSLYDIAFPNPNDSSMGIAETMGITSIINNASDDWKRQEDISVSNNIITGNFMTSDNISKYSTKYKILLDKLVGILNDKKPGKVIVYHYYVSLSGVLFIKEFLLRNGFLDINSTPLSTTRCSICGVALKDHSKIKDHNYKPARVLTAYGNMGADMERTLTHFNNKDNIRGDNYKILIGSRVIHEGIDFNCVRFMYVLSLPRDISTLIQVFGRAIRRRSHMLLPQEFRNVYIYILVSSYRKRDNISPEILNYKRKIDIYLKIQLIERELRRYAVDNFINYDKMDISKVPTIDGLPFKPVFEFKRLTNKSDYDITSFTAYGFSIKEQQEILKILKKLFAYRAVWTEEDLWNTVINPFVEIKTAYDHSTFSKENFLISLDFLINSSYIEMLDKLSLNQDYNTSYITINDEAHRVVYQKPYYILCPTDDLGIPIIDYDSFMRMDLTSTDNTISITSSIDISVSENMYKNILEQYNKNYKDNPLMSIALLHPNFHYTNIKQYVEKNPIKGMKKLLDLYEYIDFVIFYDSFVSPEIADSLGRLSKVNPIGFRSNDISYIYADQEWVKIPNSFLITKNYQEGDWVGYTKLYNGVLEFKIRPSLDTMDEFTDKRKFSKGRVCSTMHSTDLSKISSYLSITATKSKDLCNIILKNMINKQYKENSKNKGTRYFYYWFEKNPLS